MVCDTENPSLRPASCWSVEVVNGGAGKRCAGFSSALATVKVAPMQVLRNSSACSRVSKRDESSALKIVLSGSPAAWNWATTRK